MNMNLDLTALGINNDIKAQAFVVGEYMDAKDKSLADIIGRRQSVQNAIIEGLIEPHLMKEAKATLTMLNALELEKSGIAPNGSSYEKYYEVSEEQALSDAARLRDLGFTDVATDMETAIKNSDADDLALTAKHAQLLQDSHKQLDKMKVDNLKKIQDSEALLKRERDLDLRRAQG